MRVLMFGWEFPPLLSGGLGTACKGLSEALARRGIDLLFLLPRLPASVSTPARIRLLGADTLPPAAGRNASGAGRLRLLPIPARLSPYAGLDDGRPDWRQPAFAFQTLQTAGPPSVLAQPGPYGFDPRLEIERYADAAEHCAAGESFDLIHAHDWMTFPAALRARLLSGKPLIVHVHSTEFDRRGESAHPEIAAVEKAGCESADRVIAVSHQTRDQLIDRYGIPPDKIEVVHHAVRRRAAAPRPPSPAAGKIVLFLGRITHQKGPDYFVEAAGRILQTRKDITFVMAGAGDLLPRMIERVGELRIGSNFHFTGFLDETEVERIYALARVYVMPSISEPFGIAPLEALSYDVPVIIALFALASLVPYAIVALIDRPALTRELLRQGRQELRGLCWEAAAMKVENLYHALSGNQ